MRKAAILLSVALFGVMLLSVSVYAGSTDPNKPKPWLDDTSWGDPVHNSGDDTGWGVPIDRVSGKNSGSFATGSTDPNKPKPWLDDTSWGEPVDQGGDDSGWGEPIVRDYGNNSTLIDIFFQYFFLKFLSGDGIK